MKERCFVDMRMLRARKSRREMRDAARYAAIECCAIRRYADAPSKDILISILRRHTRHDLLSVTSEYVIACRLFMSRPRPSRHVQDQTIPAAPRFRHAAAAAAQSHGDYHSFHGRSASTRNSMNAIDHHESPRSAEYGRRQAGVMRQQPAVSENGGTRKAARPQRQRTARRHTYITRTRA